MTPLKIAFIGLGVMGFPMAGHLQRQGHVVCVYNRTSEKAARWCEQYAGLSADTPAGAAQDAQIVFMCVGNDNDVRSVVYGPHGVLASMAAGATLVDHTTTSAVLAEELGQACRDQGVHFMDAPVSGGQAGAIKGALTIMCGADPATYAGVESVLTAYGRHSALLGAVGQGQRGKMVNQLCIAGVLQGLSEGLLLAERSGLDIKQVIETLQHGAAGSWQMANCGETMASGQFDFGFAIDWMRKDLAIALTEAQRHHLTLPGATHVDAAYGRLQDHGHGRSDTSALILDLRT